MSTHRKIFLLVILSILGWNNMYAQKGEANNFSFNVKNFTQEGNSLLIDIDFDLQSLNISSREQLILTPVIRSGSLSLALTPLVINGKTRHKVYLRQQALGTLKDDNIDAIEVVKAGKGKPQNISYSTVVKFEEWMEQSTLYLSESNCPGCGKAVSQYERLLADNPTLEVEEIIIQESEPVFSFVVPPADTAKMGNKQGKAYLKFLVGKSAIDPSFANNRDELDKINAILEELVNDKNITIKNITLKGFASIEGTYAFNKRLSEQRAKSVQKYMEQRYNLPYNLFHVEWFGEDWDGLIALIENGNMDKKDEVLAIIKSTDIFDGREKLLMELDRGIPYRYMLKEYFPLLRKVDYVVEYKISEYSIEESKQILREHPDQLSPKEFFLLADSYGKGSPEFYNILEIALSIYPQDKITKQNAVAAYAMNGRYEVAEQLALESGNSSDALNNLGAIYIFQGKLEDARKLLSKSKLAGCQEASHNLNKLHKLLTD